MLLPIFLDTDGRSMSNRPNRSALVLTFYFSFFAHLADVLGPADFLAPLCLLLVDRLSPKVVRQASSDAAATLSLPLATLSRHSAELQFSVRLLQYLSIISSLSW
jgi:hypothetical protein